LLRGRCRSKSTGKNKGSDRLGQRTESIEPVQEMLKAEHNDMVIREADPRVTMMVAINMHPDPQLENTRGRQPAADAP
jgi:hypothetical protein